MRETFLWDVNHFRQFTPSKSSFEMAADISVKVIQSAGNFRQPEKNMIVTAICEISFREPSKNKQKSVGQGCLVHRKQSNECCIVTTNKVIPSEFDKFHAVDVQFTKKDSKRKTFCLNNIKQEVRHNAELAIIVINLDSQTLKHGDKPCSIFTKSPMTIAVLDNNMQQFCCIGGKCYNVDLQESNNTTIEIPGAPSTIPEGLVILQSTSNSTHNRVDAVGIQSQLNDQQAMTIWIHEILGDGASLEVDSIPAVPQNSLTDSPIQKQENTTGVDVTATNGVTGQEIATTTTNQDYLETGQTPGNVNQQSLGSAAAAAAGEPPNDELQNPTDSETATGGSVAQSAVPSPGGSADSQSADGASLPGDDLTGQPIEEQQHTTGIGDRTTDGVTVGKQLVSKAVRDNTGLLEKISKSLDREHRVVQCWKHLAHVLDVPAEETRTIDHFTEHSPTEDMFNYLVDIWRPELTVKELKEKLRNVHRNDIIESLDEDDFGDNMDVVDLINENPAFIALLSSKLDTETIGNWQSLATQFKIKKQKTEQFGLRGFGPTGALFLHMQTTEGLRDMKMGELREHFKEMERNDLVKILEKYQFKETDSRLVIKEVVQGSELLAEIGERLNKETTVVKNWCNLAYRMKIPLDVYSAFDTSKTEAKSPTKMMFDWLAQCKPGLQVDDLLEGLRKINRIDVVDLVTKEGSNC